MLLHINLKTLIFVLVNKRMRTTEEHAIGKQRQLLQNHESTKTQTAFVNNFLIPN